VLLVAPPMSRQAASYSPRTTWCSQPVSATRGVLRLTAVVVPGAGFDDPLEAVELAPLAHALTQEMVNRAPAIGRSARVRVLAWFWVCVTVTAFQQAGGPAWKRAGLEPSPSSKAIVGKQLNGP
jgi:hypothetical protein